MRGLFFSFEGGEGSGKTSVWNILKERLPEGEFLFVNDPSRQSVELKQMRHLLLSSSYNLSWNAELAVYGAARAQLVERLIMPALKEGVHVVCDRFHDSTAVYQGHLKGHPAGKLESMHEMFCDGLTPDKTFLFDVDAKVGLARSNDRLDAGDIDESRWEDMGLIVHENINAGYRNLAMREGYRFHILNSNVFGLEEMADRTEAAIVKAVSERIDTRRS